MTRPMGYLLGDAWDAGVRYRREADGEVILTGPQSAEPIMRELMERKREMFRYLRLSSCVDCGIACGTCYRCTDCAVRATYRTNRTEIKQ